MAERTLLLEHFPLCVLRNEATTTASRHETLEDALEALNYEVGDLPHRFSAKQRNGAGTAHWIVIDDNPRPKIR